MARNDLNAGYSYEVDQIEREDWDHIIQRFEDATIYQTWSYGAIRWGEKNLSHLVLKKSQEIVAAAQLRIRKMSVINRGIAYITWGPIWQQKGNIINYENIQQMARALINEYVNKRKLLLRIRPNVIKGTKDGNEIKSALDKEGFQWKSNSYRTIILDLELTLDELQQNLKRSWRKKLKRAEKQNLEVKEGTDDSIYKDLCLPYNEMLLRKKFTPGMDINEFRDIQNDLPDNFKMKIMTCRIGDEVIGSLLASYIGNKGVFILGGNNEKGLKYGASQLLPWRMINWMRNTGAKWCDLGGYNPDKNPGTGYFKEGFGGKDVRHIGEFEVCESLASSLIVKCGEYLEVDSERKWLPSKIIQYAIGGKKKT